MIQGKEKSINLLEIRTMLKAQTIEDPLSS